MKRSLGAASVLTTLLATLAATAVATAAPASAQEVTVTDQAGDSRPATLDLLGFTARSLDHRVVVEMTFEDTTRDGDIIVSVDPRAGSGVRMVSRFRPAGHTRNRVLAKAFGEPGAGRNATVPCRGLRLKQGATATGPTVTLSVPSRCVAGGDYGALRFAVLIEKGSDADGAPDDRHGVTDWVARG